nr:uncharacterized protein LOC129526967 isoform X3 [Gorilla gorilla gorilla]
MVGAPPPASLPPCSLISDCCASNQRDSVGVGPSKPGKCANIKVTWVCWSLLVFGLLKMVSVTLSWVRRKQATSKVLAIQEAFMPSALLGGHPGMNPTAQESIRKLFLEEA